MGIQDIQEGVDFDWIGVLADGQAKDGGEGQLRQSRKTLQNNPKFLKFNTILLFDCDQNDPEIDDGLLHVRVLLQNEENERCDKGVENLLPSAVFQDEFYNITEVKDGANEVRKKVLDKVRLCDYLCDQKRDPADFEGFRPALEQIRVCLFPVNDQVASDETDG